MDSADRADRQWLREVERDTSSTAGRAVLIFQGEEWLESCRGGMPGNVCMENLPDARKVLPTCAGVGPAMLRCDVFKRRVRSAIQSVQSTLEQGQQLDEASGCTWRRAHLRGGRGFRPLRCAAIHAGLAGEAGNVFDADRWISIVHSCHHVEPCYCAGDFRSAICIPAAETNRQSMS